MKIGVNVPNFGPGTDPGVLRGWAQTVEGLGFDLLMVSDHVAVTPDVAEQYPAPFYEPFTTLSWLAGITHRIRLGTTVLIAPYRHPLLVARMAANLNAAQRRPARAGRGRRLGTAGVRGARGARSRRGRLTDEHLPPCAPPGRTTAYYGSGAIPIWVGGNSDAGLVARCGSATPGIRCDTPGPGCARRSAVKRRGRAKDRPAPGVAPRILLRLTDDAGDRTDRRAGEGTIEQVVG